MSEKVNLGLTGRMVPGLVHLELLVVGSLKADFQVSDSHSFHRFPRCLNLDGHQTTAAEVDLGSANFGGAS